jgi:hypothetical protein
MPKLGHHGPHLVAEERLDYDSGYLALRAVAWNVRRNRSEVIARQAAVNEAVIFFCFKTKERLYREVLRRRLAEGRRRVLSKPDKDNDRSLVPASESTCDDTAGIRMLE